jgi:hypothetical protein
VVVVVVVAAAAAAVVVVVVVVVVVEAMDVWNWPASLWSSCKEHIKTSNSSRQAWHCVDPL